MPARAPVLELVESGPFRDVQLRHPPPPTLVVLRFMLDPDRSDELERAGLTKEFFPRFHGWSRSRHASAERSEARPR